MSRNRTLFILIARFTLHSSVGVIVGLVLGYCFIWVTNPMGLHREWVAVAAVLIVGVPLAFYGLVKEREMFIQELRELGAPPKLCQYFAPFSFVVIVAMQVQIVRFMP